MYSCWPPHMANQNQDDQLEHTYSSYVMIRDVTLKTCQRQWMIGRHGEREREGQGYPCWPHDMMMMIFQTVDESVLLYWSTNWTLSKCMERKLAGNFTRMLRSGLNKFWKQNPIKPLLYSHLPHSKLDMGKYRRTHKHRFFFFFEDSNLTVSADQQGFTYINSVQTLDAV